VTDSLQGQAPTDTVLVVAPSPDTVKSIGAALVGAGYKIEVIQEGDLRSVMSRPNDACLALVVSAGFGVSHPQTDAVCSLLKLRKPTVPLIVLGPDVLESKLRLFALGADDYVVDSLDRTELLARIRSLIKKRRLSSTNPTCR
jgi:two-component system, cell cycle response regulator CtrA